MAVKPTIFQRINRSLYGDGIQINNIDTVKPKQTVVNSYNINDPVIFSTTSKEERDQKLTTLRQQNYLNLMWKNANISLANESLNGTTPLKMMYRDADLMDWYPEIGAALDIVSEESCTEDDNGNIVQVHSKSERTKAVLDDLFVNRLDLHISLPMICRSTCKYGNDFMLMNTVQGKGIMGWKQLPVYEVERYEYGMNIPYVASDLSMQNDNTDRSTKFFWIGENNNITPYRNWQIAHFRLLTDSLFLPYGTSYLHKARRHWRMLSMMEDMMLIYRLDRSIERRVFKIFVGNIDDADVPAYINQIADQFKRSPIIDPQTGQVDLKMNIMNQMTDFFIPTRDPNAATPIDILQAGQNLTAMDDIKFIQNKVMTALKMPKSFLNFEDTKGDGNNLSMMDIRFSRTINRIQQALLMELTKVATIHLYLLGFTDELTNFSLTMRNPSTQAEILQLENLQKRIQAAQTAIQDPGNGIPLMSWTRALRQIMKWDDKEIEENLEEIRLEKALAVELAKTYEIITKTGMFDQVDRIYGDIGAKYSKGLPETMGGTGGGGVVGGAPVSDSDFGSDLGGSDSEMSGETVGQEGSMSMDQANNEQEGSDEGNFGEGLMKATNKLITEKKESMIKTFSRRRESFKESYLHHLNEKKKKDAELLTNIPLFDKAFLVNEELNSVAEQLNKYVGEEKINFKEDEE